MIGSIAIRSGSIQVEIGHKLVNPFLDRIVGAFGIFKKKNATLALTENEGRRGSYLQAVLAESWSSEIPEKGNLTISLKGSIDIELLSYSGSAEVALSFDSGAGGISFSVTNIAHPSLSISGLAFKLVRLLFIMDYLSMCFYHNGRRLTVDNDNENDFRKCISDSFFYASIDSLHHHPFYSFFVCLCFLHVFA